MATKFLHAGMYEETVSAWGDRAKLHAKQMADAFGRRTSREQAISMLEIIAAYKKKNIVTNEMQVRIMIHYVAKNFHPNLIEVENGFYCAVDLDELAEATKKLYDDGKVLVERIAIINQFINDNS